MNKSSYNPQKHHRRSIRLKGYDYASEGLYFITICVKNRLCLFGKIIDHEMVLNEAGIMVEKWYNELESKFPDIQCHEHVTMPNHFHCIIANTGPRNVGADLRVCPSDQRVCPNSGHENNIEEEEGEGRHIGLPQRGLPQPGLPQRGLPLPGLPQRGLPQPGSSLGTVLQWFKTMTTNEYIRKVRSGDWPAFQGKLWQRNYWEHIIRNEKAACRIAEYINNNPLHWKADAIHPKKKKVPEE